MKNMNVGLVLAIAAAGAASVYKLGKVASRKTMGFIAALLALALVAFGSAAQAQTDADAIVTTVTGTSFPLVAGACITIGTFFVVYRLVKRIR